MKKITIAIDGGAGVGKGVTAKGIAKALGYSYIDTGAMYRALTLYVLENNIDHLDEQAIVKAFPVIDISFSYNIKKDVNEVMLNGKIVEEELRKPKINNIVSAIAGHQLVRDFLAKQQKLLVKEKGVVMEGRDIGTVIAPDAELKIHLIADIDIRAKRRKSQLDEKGILLTLEEIKKNLLKRDQKDLYGKNATNYIASDAIEVDTSLITREEQIKSIVTMAEKIIKA